MLANSLFSLEFSIFHTLWLVEIFLLCRNFVPGQNDQGKVAVQETRDFPNVFRLFLSAVLFYFPEVKISESRLLAALWGFRHSPISHLGHVSL